ncbi:MAG: hypothetical protein WC519_01190 [Parcubacteria group bacterium]|jgi:hypothetical protein
MHLSTFEYTCIVAVLVIISLIRLANYYRSEAKKGKNNAKWLKERISSDIAERVKREIGEAYPLALVNTPDYKTCYDPADSKRELIEITIKVGFERSDIPFDGITVIIDEDLIMSIKGESREYSYPESVEALLAEVRCAINTKFFNPRKP